MGGWNSYIGVLRIIACFLVLVNHTASRLFLDRAPSATWFFGVLYFFVCKTAVPIFLLIMGALLLDKEDTPRRSTMRVIRVLIVTVIGSAVYTVYNAWRAGVPVDLKTFFPNLLKTNITNAFWYLYLYLALLCLLPILQRLVKALNKGQVEYILFLSLGVLGTLPLIRAFFSDFRINGYLTMALFSPYVGMVLLGYYIEHYVSNTTKNFLWAFCGFVLLITFQVAGTFLLYQRDPSSYLGLDDRTMLTITGASACLYICVRYIVTQYPLCPKLERMTHFLSDMTFGIYLLGDMLIAQTGPIHAALCEHCHVVVAMVLWEVLIFTIGAIITAGLRLVPPFKRWL